MTLPRLSPAFLLLITLLLTPELACSGQGNGGHAAPSAAKPIVVDEDYADKAVARAIRENNLTKLKDQCLLYQYHGAASKHYGVVDVRENHRHAMCGGDPATAPHLFTFHVDRKNGALSTDAGSTDGSFRPGGR